jgi:hypothetical protein
MFKGKKDRVKVVNKGGPLGFFFFAAWIGALIHFEQLAYGFWPSIGAFFKSIVWPAYVIHNVLILLKVR